MMGFLNVGSLIFGLVAWILPIISLTKRDKSQLKKMMLFSVLSLISCAIALYMQILYGHHLVVIGDWSALMDIAFAVSFVAGFLLIVTVVLNLFIARLYNRISRGE